ncbi:hypothetical protein ACP4OV_015459 [Aristida adscensionis]
MAPRRGPVPATAALCALLAVAALGGATAGEPELSPAFYDGTCPHVHDTVRRVVQEARVADPRVPASLLRLHFHDCFVNGCDGSLLLDGTPAMASEKGAELNNGSARGFDVVDAAKAAVEAACPGVVSCADVLALAAEVSVELAGGPSWRVMLGRRDGMAPNFDGAQNLPSPTERCIFSRGSSPTSASTTPILSPSKVRAHTIGRAQCRFVQDRLYDFSGTRRPDPTMDQAYLAALQQRCPAAASDDESLNDLDPASPDAFDDGYYASLLRNRGLLRSDQAMLSTPEEGAASTATIVERFAGSQAEFFRSFATAMIKMGNIAPLTGSMGEVRRNCRVVNAN